jgi:hypothetical protein
MPRAAKTEAEKELEQQVKDLIKNIKGTDKPAVDIPRAISLFESAHRNITKALAVLKGEEVEEVGTAKKPRKNASKASAAVLDGACPAFEIGASEVGGNAEIVADDDKGAQIVAGENAAPRRQSGNPRQHRNR